MSYSILFQRLLKARRFDDDFLSPRYATLSDPFSLQDMDICVARILSAAKNHEKIVIYGDYDVDGVCSSTLMHDALVSVGCQDIKIILPDRFGDGYGMNLGAIPEIAKTKATLAITVDCGSGSEHVIAKLKEQGIDTIVTDHHEIPEIPKSAIATINPKRGKTLHDLAGVGVTFEVARALNLHQNNGQCDGSEKWLLDLVAIGTICDAMPITGENRTLVYWGLRVLAKTRRPGLQELMKISNIDPKSLSTHSVGFQLGPRLNASGRMGSAYTSLDLLISKTRPAAFKFASELERLNKERRKVQDAAISELESSGIADQPIITVKGNWHEGVIGIIAGRLMETHKKPTFVFTEVENGLLKGSGRSFGDFNLAYCITHCQNMLVKGGGHNFACGLTIANSNFENFTNSANDLYRSLKLPNQDKYLKTSSDLDVDNFTNLTEALCDELSLLEPYGAGNSEPVFSTTAKILNTKILKEKHLSLNLCDNQGQTLRLMAFFAPQNWLNFEENTEIHIKFTLTLNEWNNRRTVEGRIVDVDF
ncbi:MAG: single-stranded-DNA-specific exonuclease RecJ [Candidatus Nomurabacteria bacterium]|jgi:single-stranded-DNA-specific exonuclease|nr:single-stranded-DNA-specific exonuclease RecJ [Candidatus Nomurabacteria bacterium]